MSLVNKTSMYLTTTLYSNTDDTETTETQVNVIEHSGVAYVEVDASGVYLSHSTLAQLTLMVELHQRRIDTV